MKLLPQLPIEFLVRRTSRRNAKLLLGLIGALVGFVLLYTVLFEYLMALEQQHHSWPTAVYWVVTNMSTLGLGDITFTSDIGRIFNIVVLVSGMMFILVLLPFTFIQLFQSSARIPRELPAESSGHVVLTHFGTVTSALINRLRRYGQPYVLVLDDINEAVELIDSGIRVVAGDINDPETYRRVRSHRAALVAATDSDVANTAMVYAVRQVTKDVPIIATASSSGAEEVLHIAGCNYVLKLDEMMGQSLARRTTGGDALAHEIGHFDELVIAEATASGTPLVDKTLREIMLRELVGATVIGVWERGRFSTVTPDTRITNRTVLVLAGSQAHIDRYNELFCIYNAARGHVLIIGGGNVGTAMARALTARDLPHRIIEKIPRESREGEVHITGDASDPRVLERAGIADAPTVAITTREDNVNIFLTTYIRHLHPSVQIISRATLDRSIRTLHEAGADFVMSYASMGAYSIFNLLQRGNILMVAEGVDVFRVPLPDRLAGKAIAESAVRENFGCSIVGVGTGAAVVTNPDPGTILEKGFDLILIGTVESENRFLQHFRTFKRPAKAKARERHSSTIDFTSS